MEGRSPADLLLMEEDDDLASLMPHSFAALKRSAETTIDMGSIEEYLGSQGWTTEHLPAKRAGPSSTGVFPAVYGRRRERRSSISRSAAARTFLDKWKSSGAFTGSLLVSPVPDIWDSGEDDAGKEKDQGKSKKSTALPSNARRRERREKRNGSRHKGASRSFLDGWKSKAAGTGSVLCSPIPDFWDSGEDEPKQQPEVAEDLSFMHMNPLFNIESPQEQRAAAPAVPATPDVETCSEGQVEIPPQFQANGDKTPDESQPEIPSSPEARTGPMKETTAFAKNASTHEEQAEDTGHIQAMGVRSPDAKQVENPAAQEESNEAVEVPCQPETSGDKATDAKVVEEPCQHEDVPNKVPNVKQVESPCAPQETRHEVIEEAATPDEDVAMPDVQEDEQQKAEVRHQNQERAKQQRQKKLAYKSRQSLAGAGLTIAEGGRRRSTRTRTRVLAFWQNETICYQRSHTSLPTVSKVIMRSLEPQWPRPLAKKGKGGPLRPALQEIIMSPNLQPRKFSR